MRVALQLRDSCVSLRLRPGAEVRCTEGSLWITSEARRPIAPSADVVLSAGQHYRVDADATYFLSSFWRGGVGGCELDLSREAAHPLARALGLAALAQTFTPLRRIARWPLQRRLQLIDRAETRPASARIHCTTRRTSSRGWSSA